MNMHIRERVVASIPAKGRRDTVYTRQSVGAERCKQAKDVHAQTLGLARANWQTSVQAEFKVVQKLAIGRTG